MCIAPSCRRACVAHDPGSAGGVYARLDRMPVLSNLHPSLFRHLQLNPFIARITVQSMVQASQQYMKDEHIQSQYYCHEYGVLSHSIITTVNLISHRLHMTISHPAFHIRVCTVARTCTRPHAHISPIQMLSQRHRTNYINEDNTTRL